MSLFLNLSLLNFMAHRNCERKIISSHKTSYTMKIFFHCRIILCFAAKQYPCVLYKYYNSMFNDQCYSVEVERRKRFFTTTSI